MQEDEARLLNRDLCMSSRRAPAVEIGKRSAQAVVRRPPGRRRGAGHRPRDGAVRRLTVVVAAPTLRDVRSDAESIDDYVAAAPEARRAMLAAWRDLCRLRLTGFDEAMRYGMPGYSRDGQVEVGWASQARYLSLYITRTDVLEAHRARLTGLDVGKGCIRYRKPADVDLEVVDSMLKATAATHGPVC